MDPLFRLVPMGEGGDHGGERGRTMDEPRRKQPPEETVADREEVSPPPPIDPYEDARLSGLCEEGAEEVARRRTD